MLKESKVIKSTIFRGNSDKNYVKGKLYECHTNIMCNTIDVDIFSNLFRPTIHKESQNPL